MCTVRNIPFLWPQQQRVQGGHWEQAVAIGIAGPLRCLLFHFRQYEPLTLAVQDAHCNDLTFSLVLEPLLCICYVVICTICLLGKKNKTLFTGYFRMMIVCVFIVLFIFHLSQAKLIFGKEICRLPEKFCNFERKVSISCVLQALQQGWSDHSFLCSLAALLPFHIQMNEDSIWKGGHSAIKSWCR